jgi:hypothetical protein
MTVSVSIGGCGSLSLGKEPQPDNKKNKMSKYVKVRIVIIRESMGWINLVLLSEKSRLDVNWKIFCLIIRPAGLPRRATSTSVLYSP